jgi:uncharacterized protein YacL
MNESEVQFDSIAAFSVCVVMTFFLLLFQIPIAKRISRITNEAMSSTAALRILYAICSSVIGLCLAEMTKSIIFGLLYFQRESTHDRM